MLTRTTGNPTHDDVRAALDRILASDALRHSPQLIAFLRFIVETTLRGESGRIKGYTVGIEALSREEDFDPQIDPIVRVEAARLRRALIHYYNGPGATDDVVIDLPRGHYIPTFRRRPDSQESAFRKIFGIARGSLTAIPHSWCAAIAAIVLVLIGTTALTVFGRWNYQNWPNLASPTDQQLMSAFRAGNGLPVVSVQPFEAVGMPAVSTIALDRLRRRLIDALARFDEINVAFAAATAHAGATDNELVAEGPSASKYHIAAEYHGRGDLTFRLTDMGENTVVWVRTFDQTQFSLNSNADEGKIVHEVAATVARTFGVIHARERGKVNQDPRYACVLKMFDYLQGLDTGKYIQARACFERLTRLDPNFADGFAWLSLLYIREYQYERVDYPGDSRALDRALRAAHKAVALKPQSARAHEAMLGAYFARGDFAAAFAEGDTALALNPFDPATSTVYGMRLVVVGQYDRGVALLKEALTSSAWKPTWLNFYLFLAAYLKDDLAAATDYANQDVSEAYPLNFLARALTAAGNGNRDNAKQMIERLDILYPTFRPHLRDELQKFIPSAAIVDRMMHDLAAADLDVAK